MQSETNLEYKVQYADTDAYGVVWHGTYLRWMEAGRVEWLFANGVRIDELARDFGIVMPVVDINIKYKFSAKLLNNVIVSTIVKEHTAASVTFYQVVKIKETGKVCTAAEVRATAIDKNGKIIRDLAGLIGLKNPKAENPQTEALKH